jgi:hypothetical protein
MSKTRNKQNALKHGAHAAEVLLWSEKYEDYEALRVGLDLEYFPSGSSEQYLVSNLLDLLWRRKRLQRHERIKTQKRLEKVRHQNYLAYHIANLRAMAPEFEQATTVEQVEKLLSILSPLYRNTILPKWPVPSGKDSAGSDHDPNTWGAKIAEGLASWTPPDRLEDADAFLAVLDLDEFDEALTRVERLDAMIDRTIKRLLQLKTQKQIFRQLEPKLINSTTAAAE